LVVIAIIGVLMLLSAGAVFKVLGTQYISNTRTTLQKVGSQLNKQWKAVTERATKEPIPSNQLYMKDPKTGAGYYYDYNSMVLRATNGDAIRARTLWVSLRQKQVFPMTFDEVLKPSLPPSPTTQVGFYDLPPPPGYVSTLQGLGFTGSSAATQPYEAAACLLLALQRGEGGGGVSVEDLGVSSSIGSIPTPAGGRLQFLADSWGTPVTFARWPTSRLHCR